MAYIVPSYGDNHIFNISYTYKHVLHLQTTTTDTILINLGNIRTILHIKTSVNYTLMVTVNHSPLSTHTYHKSSNYNLNSNNNSINDITTIAPTITIYSNITSNKYGDQNHGHGSTRMVLHVPVQFKT